MSEIKHSDKEFTNDDTVLRRAWVDKALAGVRRRFSLGEEQLAPSENMGREKSARPRLRVVDSTRDG